MFHTTRYHQSLHLYARVVLVVLLLSFCPSVRGQRQDSVVAHGLRALPDVPFYDDCSVVLLPSGVEKYEDLFAAIQNAHRYVHLEYFKFYNDCIGGELLDLLRRKVDEGVEVRVLVDGFGNRGRHDTFDRQTLDSLRQLGIKIELYNPMRFPWIPCYVYRDHRKIAVIDGEVAYLGGMNVADYYIEGKPRVGEWRDMHVRLDGPVVEGVESIFSRMWFDVTGEYLDSLQYAPQLLSEYSYRGMKMDRTATAGAKRIALVNRKRGRLSANMRMAYALAIDAARDSICIVNPYLTNVPLVRKAMLRALRRGVKLKIMVSAKMDIHVTPDVVGMEMKRLMRHGAEIYYCENAFHHDKYMTVDGLFCTVGTANIDGRSLRFDHEVNVFVFDRHTTRQLDELMNRELSQCSRLTKEGWRKRYSLGHRILGRVARVANLFF